MALGSIFGDISGGLRQATPLLSGIGNLMDVFGVGKPKMNYGPTPSEQQAQSLALALADPNNSLVGQHTDMNFQRGMQDFLMQLKQMQMLDARRQSRGMRGTFFKPERADESLDFLTSRGLPTMRDKARVQARGDISDQITTLLGLATPERVRADQLRNDKLAQYEKFGLGGGYQGMAGQLSGGLQDLFGAIGKIGGGNNSYNPAFVGPYQPFPWQVN